MFGKNDSLVDSSYKHAPAQPQQNLAHQEMSFGAAGGEMHAAAEDFMSATPQAPAAMQPAPTSPQPEPQFAAQTFAAQGAAPVMEEYAAAPQAEPAAAMPVEEIAAEDAPRVAPTPSSRTTTMSFSEMMAMRQAQQPAAPAPEMAEDFTQPPAGVTEVSPAEATPEAFAPEAPAAEEIAADTLTAEPADISTEPQEISFAPEVIPEDTPEAAEGFTLEQTTALQTASAAFSHPDLELATGKARLHAATLSVLVNKALTQDAAALGQLTSHGFELLEKLADDLPPGSPALDAAIGSAATLIGAGLVFPADSKAQQTDALQTIAEGVSLQGQVAATQQQQAEDQQSFAQREAEKKSTRQEGVSTGQYL